MDMLIELLKTAMYMEMRSPGAGGTAKLGAGLKTGWHHISHCSVGVP